MALQGVLSANGHPFVELGYSSQLGVILVEASLASKEVAFEVALPLVLFAGSLELAEHVLGEELIGKVAFLHLFHSVLEKLTPLSQISCGSLTVDHFYAFGVKLILDFKELKFLETALKSPNSGVIFQVRLFLSEVLSVNSVTAHSIKYHTFLIDLQFLIKKLNSCPVGYLSVQVSHAVVEYSVLNLCFHESFSFFELSLVMQSFDCFFQV